MKYKAISGDDTPSQKTRIDYLYDNFCIDETLTPQTFIHHVKVAYYKFNRGWPCVFFLFFSS